MEILRGIKGIIIIFVMGPIALLSFAMDDVYIPCIRSINRYRKRKDKT